MGNINIGDRVKIKEKKCQPSPPKCILANSEGTVVRWYESEEVFGKFKDFICVHLDKSEDSLYNGAMMYFKSDDLEKI